MLGLAGTLTLLVGDIDFGGLVLAERTMVLTAAGINVGFEAMLFWMFAKLVAIQRGLLLRDVTFERLRRAIPLERGLVLGAVFILLGLTAFMAAVSEWST